MAHKTDAVMPSDVSEPLGPFDRFAGAAGRLVSRAPFFALSLVLVLTWVTEGIVLAVMHGSWNAVLNDTYQLQINTLTTIITFLLVALLQNTQSRADDSVQQKLNAIADALADLMLDEAKDDDNEELRRDVAELRAAVGLEDREGTKSRPQ